MTPIFSSSFNVKKPVILAWILCSALMTGCTRPDGMLPNFQEDDLRERHHVKQQTRIQKLSIIPTGSGHNHISPSDLTKTTRFIEDFQSNGLSNLTIEFIGSNASEPELMKILKDLNEKRTTIKISHLKSNSAEIILSYTSIQIVIDKNCEGKNTDGGYTLMVPNKTMGCAYGLAFAQQVDQPRDLIEPQPREKVYYTPKATASVGTKNSESKSNDPAGSLIDGLKTMLSGN